MASNGDALNCNDLVSKLIAIADQPVEIWDEFNKQLPGFFIKCIQKEYGIGDDYSKKVTDDFN